MADEARGSTVIQVSDNEKKEVSPKNVDFKSLEADELKQLQAVYSRVRKPDETSNQEKMKDFEEKITDLNEKLSAIKGETKSDPFQKLQSQISEANEELQDIRRKIKLINVEKDSLHEESKNLVKKKGDDVTALKKLKDGMKFKSVEEYDEAITDLEYRIQTESKSVQEEKKMIDEISKLRKEKLSTSSLDTQVTAIQDKNKEIAELHKRMKGMKEEVGVLKDEEARKRKHLDTLFQQKKTSFTKIDALRSQRRELQAEISKLINERRAISEAYRKEYNEYNSGQKKVAGIRWELRRRQREKEQEERKKLRDQQEEEKELVNPNLEKINACKSLVVYLESVRRGKSENADEEPTSQPKGEIELPSDALAIGKSSNALESFEGFQMSNPTMREKSKKKKRGKRGANVNSTDRIVVDIDVMKQFMLLGLVAPTKFADIEDKISLLKEKVEQFEEDFKVLVKERERKRQEKKEKQAAEAQAAAAAAEAAPSETADPVEPAEPVADADAAQATPPEPVQDEAAETTE